MSRTHSPTFPSLHLRHNSFSNPSVALPMSQLILQPFFLFSYVTSSSLNSPGQPPMQSSGSGSIPGRVKDYNLYPGTGCAFYLVLMEALTFYWPEIRGDPIYSCLEVWSIACGYRSLTHGHLSCKSRGVHLHWRRANNWKRKKERDYTEEILFSIHNYHIVCQHLTNRYILLYSTKIYNFTLTMSRQ